MKRIYNNHNIMFVSMLTICFIIGIYIAGIKYFDPFAAQDLIPVNYLPSIFPLDDELFIDFVRIDSIIGFIITSIILNNVTNLHADELIILPIGYLLLPIGYYVLLKNALPTNSKYYNIIILLVPLTVTIYSGLIGLYGWFKYTITYFLFILLLNIFIKIPFSQYKIIYILLFIGLSMMHYSLAFMIIITLFILLLSKQFVTINNKNKHITSNLVISFLIIFIIQHIDLYSTYKIFVQQTNITINDLINRLLTYVGQEKELERFRVASWAVEDANVNVLKFIYSILISLPIVIYLLLLLYKKLFNTNFNLPSLGSIWFGVIIAILLRGILYFNIGVPAVFGSTNLILFPLISVIIIIKSKFNPYISLIYIVIIAIVSFLSLILILDDIDYTSRYETIQFITEFLYNTQVFKHRLIGDHQDLALLALLYSKQGELLSISYINDVIYKNLIEDTTNLETIILHYDSKPIVGSPIWIFYEPINKYSNKLNNDNQMNRIYDDSINFIIDNKSKVILIK